jgi:GT2 family glycosyltransferase
MMPQTTTQPVTDRETTPEDLPFVDISIVTHNSARWIERFFDSLTRQDYPTHLLGIHIRDNASTDDTMARCQAVLARNGSRFKSFHLTEGENLGFGYGHNRNLSSGNAPFFLVTNVDLEFAADAIRQAVTTAIRDEDITASWEFRQKPYEHPKLYHPVTLETRWSSSACILLRRTAIEAVGGYEERIFMYGEDVELSYRLRDHGHKLRYCPKAVCWHYSYEHAGELKPLQFFGSTLANFYIRLRYGSFFNILAGFLLYLSLWPLHPPKVPNLWRGLLHNGWSMLRHGPYFLLSRKKSRERFPLRRWDYEAIRDGAFYAYPQPPSTYPLISVIMRTYSGRLSWLREAVISVYNQTYPHIELIVVEDGSEEARAFMDETARASTLASVVYHPLPKLGRCKAGNAGLALAKGEYLIFLDDDDLFFADHLEVLALELLARPEIGASYALAFQVPTRVSSTKPVRYEEGGYITAHRQPFSRPILWHHNYLPIQAVLFRRNLYEQYGGLDESLDNLEDWNLWTRYSLERDFLLVEKTTSLYRVPADRKGRMQRQQSLDGYYAKAVEKQRELRVTLSPADTMDYAKELSNNINALVIPYLPIRNALVKNRLLNLFYYVAVRVVAEIRAQRRKMNRS